MYSNLTTYVLYCSLVAYCVAGTVGSHMHGKFLHDDQDNRTSTPPTPASRLCPYKVEGEVLYNCTNTTRGPKPHDKMQRLLEQQYPESLFKAVYWEVKPYVFRNKHGEMDGFYPTVFKNAMHFCGYQKNETLFKMFNASRLIEWNEFRMTTRRKFLELYTANSYPEGLTPGRDVYFPAIYRATEMMADIEKRKKFMNFDVAQSQQLALIVHRDYISLPYKIFRGIKSCGQIFFITMLLTILFGILIWLSERINNPAFPNTCFNGTGAGVWWSFVSMTTVGYGDVVPNSILGRIIAVVWVCIGVMIACIVTATVTEVVNGVGDLNLSGRRVSVLENSTEADRALNDFRADIVEYETYDLVLRAVRDGDVFAAAINFEVAAWDIENIQDDDVEYPLRIVRLLPTSLNLNMVFSTEIPLDFKQIIKCMHKFKTEVYERAKTKFSRYCPTETLYIESVGDLFKSAFVQVLLGIVFLLVLIGIGVDTFYRRSLEKQTFCDNTETQVMIEASVRDPEKKNGYAV